MILPGYHKQLAVAIVSYVQYWLESGSLSKVSFPQTQHDLILCQKPYPLIQSLKPLPLAH